jgi:hypothetical protein
MRKGYLAGLMLLAVVAGCEEDKMKGLVAPAALPTQAVRAYVVQEPGGTSEKVTLTIHVEARGIPVAAYQGRLEFDASALDILEATTPTDDGSRIVNPKVRPGVIKFAGFAPEAFAHTAAVTLVVKPKKPIDMANLLATLDVVGEAKGTRVAKEHVIVEKGVFTTIAKQ